MWSIVEGEEQKKGSGLLEWPKKKAEERMALGRWDCYYYRVLLLLSEGEVVGEYLSSFQVVGGISALEEGGH